MGQFNSPYLFWPLIVTFGSFHFGPKVSKIEKALQCNALQK